MKTRPVTHVTHVTDIHANPDDSPQKDRLVRVAKLLAIFIDAVETREEIRDPLAAVGLNEAERADAKALLSRDRVLRSGPRATAAPPPCAPAMRACERFLAGPFVAARGKLALRFPEQLAAVCGGLEVDARGTEAAIMVAAFVERACTLEHAVGRSATRKEDRAALAAMAEAGVTPAALRELDRVAKIALSTERSLVVPDAAVLIGEPEDEHLENLRRIHAWYSVWSDIARRVIKNKRHLAALGVRRPRRKTKATSPVLATPRLAPPAILSPEDRAPDSRAA